MLNAKLIFLKSVWKIEWSQKAFRVHYHPLDTNQNWGIIFIEEFIFVWHKRSIDAFNKMKMKRQEYRKFTVTASELPKLYIPIKTHKADFPGRPVLSQINEPMYNIWKELTKIVLPIAMKGRSFIKDSYSLQQK